MQAKKKFKVVLTGGGTAGHVMPHLALIPEMKKRGWSLEYIGTAKGVMRLLSIAAVPMYSRDHPLFFISGIKAR